MRRRRARRRAPRRNGFATWPIHTQLLALAGGGVALWLGYRLVKAKLPGAEPEDVDPTEPGYVPGMPTIPNVPGTDRPITDPVPFPCTFMLPRCPWKRGEEPWWYISGLSMPCLPLDAPNPHPECGDPPR